MMKQYGIDPELVLWIQRSAGRDLQTFSDLARIKCLDNTRRNYGAAKKIDEVRLPSWLVVRDHDFSLIGEMTKLRQLILHDIEIDDYSFLDRCKCLSTLDLQDTNFSDCRLLAGLPALRKVLLPPYSQLEYTEVLEQLSCHKETQKERKEPKETKQSCKEGRLSPEELPSPGSLHLGDTAHLSMIPYLFTEGQETESHDAGMQKRGGMDYPEMIRKLYAVEELQGYTEEEISIAKRYFGSIPKTLEDFWQRAARTEALHKVQDTWIKPENFDRWDWLKDDDYLVILNENQGCCRVGIRRKDLTKADPPVYVTVGDIDDRKWTLCTGTFSEFLLAALAYEAVFTFPFYKEELVYWLTEEELEIVQTGLVKQPFELHGWLGMDMSFYSNADDNMAVIMDCGDLEVLFGAASEAGYGKLMEVMEGIGEAV